MPVGFQVGLLILLFCAGLIARRADWLKPPQAGRMMRLVITVGLPALFLANVSSIALHRNLVVLPGVAFLVMLSTLAVAFFLGRWMALSRPIHGAFIVCSMSLNNAFLFPFVIAGWGPGAFAQLALFDLGNAVLQATAIYGVAAAFGHHDAHFTALLRRMLSFPPLWALVIALIINLAGWHLPPLLTSALGWVGRIILQLVVLAMGVLFDARLLRSGRVAGVVALRMLFGFAVAALVVQWLGITGVTRAVLLLGGAAPIGFSAVVMCSAEGLDRDLAASAASLSAALGMILVPLAIWLLNPA